MIRPGRQLSIDPFLDLILAAPGDDSINQTITASVLEIGGSEALGD